MWNLTFWFLLVVALGLLIGSLIASFTRYGDIESVVRWFFLGALLLAVAIIFGGTTYRSNLWYTDTSGVTHTYKGIYQVGYDRGYLSFVDNDGVNHVVKYKTFKTH